MAMGVQAIPDFADDFADFSPMGSSVTFVLPGTFKPEAEAALEGAPAIGHCVFRAQYADEGNPASIQVCV